MASGPHERGSALLRRSVWCAARIAEVPKTLPEFVRELETSMEEVLAILVCRRSASATLRGPRPGLRRPVATP
jgi:hypothetical protein